MRSPYVLAALLVALAPLPVAAQRPGDRFPAPPRLGWPPATVGIHAGYDYNSTGSVLGAQLRLPVIPSGHLEVMPYGDVTFLTGLREYQGGVELVVVSGGRRGGLYAGGGVAWRNTIYEGPERETRRAPTVVAGARSSGLFGAPFGTQIEMRWTFPEGDFKPRALMLGINVPLWGRRDGRR